MSTKTVIIWLVLAVGLGAVALVLFAPPGNTTPIPGIASSQIAQRVPMGEKLMELVPAKVRSISVNVGSSSGSRLVIQRPESGTGALGGDCDWELKTVARNPNDFVPGPWPLVSSQVQSLLRVLSEARAVGAPSTSSLAEPADKAFPNSVNIDLSDSGVIRLLLPERTLAGTAMVQVDTGPGTPARRAIVEDTLSLVFTTPGPRGWRESAPCAPLASEASRFTLENSRQKLALAKVGGQWIMREPVSVAADPGAVQKLASVLAAARIADFLDPPTSPSAATGLENPSARLTIEADRRFFPPGASEAKTRTETLNIAVGGPADAGNSRVYVSINDSRVVLMDARSLAAILTDPTLYVWPHPVRRASADVHAIALKAATDPKAEPSGLRAAGDRCYVRSDAGWAQCKSPESVPIASAVPSESAIGVPLSDKDMQEVSALLAFLTGGDRTAFSSGSSAIPGIADASMVTTLTPPDNLRRVGVLELHSSLSSTARAQAFSAASNEQSAKDTPLESIELWSNRSADLLTIHAGPVYRTYPIAKLPTILGDFAARLAARPSAQPLPSEPDLTK